jgi:hypothetical protein
MRGAFRNYWSVLLEAEVRYPAESELPPESLQESVDLRVQPMEQSIDAG